MEEQLISPADFPRPEGGVTALDRILGMRGGVPFSATPSDLSSVATALVLTESNKPKIQELAGIDYSLLTEQVVPGEFWLVDGVKKQVFVRTFKGTLSTTGELTIITTGVTSAHVVTGLVGTYGQTKDTVPFILLGVNAPAGGAFISYNIQTNGNLFLFHSAIYYSKSYIVTFKYTK